MLSKSHCSVSNDFVRFYHICCLFHVSLFLFFLLKLLEDTEARISWPCLGNVSWCITLSPSSLMSQAAACRHRLAGQVVGANARQLAASWNLPGSGSLGSDAYWLWDWRSTWNWDFEMLRLQTWRISMVPVDFPWNQFQLNAKGVSCCWNMV